MHELGITGEIVRIAEEACRKNQVTPVRVFVDIGDMTTYKEEQVIYYYEMLKKNSKILKNSAIEVSVVPGDDIRVREIEAED